MINGIPAIKHKLTKETTLVGKYGEIYENGADFVAILWSTRIYNDLVSALCLDLPKASGDCERLLKFKLVEFPTVVKILQITREPGRQLTRLKKHYYPEEV